MRLILAVLILSFWVGASSAAADVRNGAGVPGDTTVIGGGDDVLVIVENGGEEIAVVEGGRSCVYRKLTIGEIAALPGLPVDLSPDEAGEFIVRTFDDGRVEHLYVRECVTAAGGLVFDYFWIEDTNPGDVTEIARRELEEAAPAPAAAFSPGAGVNQLVGLPTFVWLEGAGLAPISVTASIPGLSATATATPSRLLLDPGDGSDPIDCGWTAEPYLPGADPATGCTHTFRYVSSHSTTGVWRFMVTVDWQVSWTNSLGEFGVADPLQTQSSYPLTVVEIQPRTING